MPLINCKVELLLKWHENCIFSSARTSANFVITDTKLYVLIVTLKTEDNTKLWKVLSKGFKRPIYLNKYKIIFKNYNDEYVRERLDATFQGVNRLFVLAYLSGDNITNKNSYRNIFFQDLKSKNSTSKLMEEIFMISQLMTQLNNMTKLEKYQQGKVMIILLVLY